ncbi:TonB-dependent receptor plug domain-containing protein [Rhizorhabdus argentea]|uniref:TonB-dependent receptor plug domain-containing protein n=1 Tax=Rhizorhabdus argentea TaxID=1387174 RepID=UPI0030EC263D
MNQINRKMRCAIWVAGAAPLAISAALSAPAHAQATPAPAAAAAEPIPPENVIIVTGSRIARPELAAATPIAVVGSPQIQAQGVTNVSDLVQELPQAGIPGISTTNSNFNTTGNGISTINLRNLDTARTLVLVNGRRFVPGVAGTSIVDVNNIPTDFVDRVEVVTGGASAVYGSDAIAGVVNFVLKDKVDGLIARGQYGLTSRGDNRRYSASLTGGMSFGSDDRGSVIANFTYDRDYGLLSRKRKISAQDCLFTCGPEAYSSFAEQGRFVLVGDSPEILTTAEGTPTDTFTFNPDNSVVTGFPVGYGYNRNSARRISTPVERYLGAASAKYELTDHVTAFIEGTYAHTRSSSQIEAAPFGAGAGIPQPDLPLGYGIDNPFIPASIASAIAARNSDADPTNDITSISFARRQTEIFTRSNTNRRDTFRIAGGFRGDIADKWNYEVSAVYGQLKDHTQTQDVDLTKYAAALDAVRDPTGAIVCRDPAARAAGCVPINLFGYNSASPEASAYVRSAVPRSDDVKNTQLVVTANISGTAVTLPYGDLKVSVGAEYRREKSVDNWDPLTNAGLNSGNLTPDTIGKYNVKELFGEVDIPLLKDLPFARSLSLQGAVRYSDYSTIGKVFSWNAGAEYSPVDGLRLRGNYAVANRAPNISELFSAPSETFPTVQDPCNGITATSGGGDFAAACRDIPAVAAAIARAGIFQYGQADLQGINGFDGGNPNLQEEKGKTLTLGAVISPRALPGFSLTADYFDIKVSNAIGIVPRQTSIQECLTTGLAQFCNNVIRDPNTGFITTVNAQNINIANLRTRGIDFNLNYNRRLGLMADDRLAVNILYTRTLKYKTQSDPSAPVESGLGNLEYGEVFKHKINATINYSFGPISLNWTTTYLSKMVDTPVDEFDPAGTLDFLINSAGLTPEQAARAVSHNNIKARLYHDVQLRARAGDKEQFEFFVGVDNLFDRKPPILEDGLFFGSITGTTTAADVYDPFGRRFYAGVQVKF